MVNGKAQALILSRLSPMVRNSLDEVEVRLAELVDRTCSEPYHALAKLI